MRYLGWEQDGELQGGAAWGRDLAIQDVLKRSGKKGLFDLGNAEIILPIAADAQVPVHHRGRYLSALNEDRQHPQTPGRATGHGPYPERPVEEISLQ